MNHEQIRAFCIDFNWDSTLRYASPGLYAQANPAEHLKWYKDLGVNTIQSFCVSHNGYAWYKSDVAPRMPTMPGSFFSELAEAAKKEDMRVMGYFSPGANEYWRKTYPDYSHDRLCKTYWHMPFSERFNEYLAAEITDAMGKIPMDGFMIDFMLSVDPTWLPVERQMYTELLGEKFPYNAVPDEATTREFQIRSVRRAWTRIRETAKAIDKNTIIWLSSGNIENYQVSETGVGAECDWLMNEYPTISSLDAARRMTGADATIMQCVCGWEGDNSTAAVHDAKAIFEAIGGSDVGIYGFARPDEVTTLPKVEGDNANARNIRAMRANFR
jgi:hypothetical protein